MAAGNARSSQDMLALFCFADCGEMAHLEACGGLEEKKPSFQVVSEHPYLNVRNYMRPFRPWFALKPVSPANGILSASKAIFVRGGHAIQSGGGARH